MEDRIREAIFRQVQKEPFARKFALRLMELDSGYSRVEMDLSPDMENLFGMTHGGALFALMDEAFETASNSHGTIAVALSRASRSVAQVSSVAANRVSRISPIA